MFKFSIRDLLWLTLVVGLVLGWWINRRQLYADARHWEFRAETVQEFLTARGMVANFEEGEGFISVDIQFEGMRLVAIHRD